MSSSSSASLPAQHVPKRGRGRPRLRRNIRIESTRRAHPDYRKLTRALVGIVESNLIATRPATRPAGSPPVGPHAPVDGLGPTQPAKTRATAPVGDFAPHTGAPGGTEVVE